MQVCSLAGATDSAWIGADWATASVTNGQIDSRAESRAGLGSLGRLIWAPLTCGGRPLCAYRYAVSRGCVCHPWGQHAAVCLRA